MTKLACAWCGADESQARHLAATRLGVTIGAFVDLAAMSVSGSRASRIRRSFVVCWVCATLFARWAYRFDQEAALMGIRNG